MQSSDTSRALSQVKLLIEALNEFIESLQNTPPTIAVTREKDEAIEESTNLCLTLSKLENSGIFEIDAAAIRIPQLRPLFIELWRYERCRKSVADVMIILQESLTRRNSEPITLTTAIISKNIPTTLPEEEHENHLIANVEVKETPKSHRFRKIISAVKGLRRNQQQVIKNESTISETAEPSIVEKADTKQGVNDDRPDSFRKELTYTVWKIRGVSSFLNGILADWVSTELREPEPKWEAWKIEVFKLAGWRSDIVVQSEPQQRVSTQPEIIVQGNQGESTTGVPEGEDNSNGFVSGKSKETSAGVSSYKSEIAPAKCGRCLGYFNVEPRCLCH
ncbi:hypothetical protein ZTR_01777 [Talaromyces verruculosus]|nr:hypothetical protein ZTR_01777 [Talaromyces verruculosus]